LQPLVGIWRWLVVAVTVPLALVAVLCLVVAVQLFLEAQPGAGMVSVGFCAGMSVICWRLGCWALGKEWRVSRHATA
jgi:hypothetical protein